RARAPCRGSQLQAGRDTDLLRFVERVAARALDADAVCLHGDRLDETVADRLPVVLPPRGHTCRAEQLPPRRIQKIGLVVEGLAGRVVEGHAGGGQRRVSEAARQRRYDAVGGRIELGRRAEGEALLRDEVVLQLERLGLDQHEAAGGDGGRGGG